MKVLHNTRYSGMDGLCYSSIKEETGNLTFMYPCLFFDTRCQCVSCSLYNKLPHMDLALSVFQNTPRFLNFSNKFLPFALNLLKMELKKLKKKVEILNWFGVVSLTGFAAATISCLTHLYYKGYGSINCLDMSWALSCVSGWLKWLCQDARDWVFPKQQCSLPTTLFISFFSSVEGLFFVCWE